VTGRVIPIPQSREPGPQHVNIDAPRGEMDFAAFVPDVMVVAGDRQLVWQDDFSPGWETRLDWIFRETDLTAVDHPNFNGFGGVDVTYPAGSDANVRWGGQIRLPNHPTGYEEGWFTFDIMLNSPYSVPVNEKCLGVFGGHGAATDTNSCDTGWLVRVQLGDGTSTTDPFNGPQSAQTYSYEKNNGPAHQNYWLPGRFSPMIPYDVVCRIELYWKPNTAFNLADGIVQHRFDPGTALAHATPTTLRSDITDFQMYCGSEANRFSSFVNEVSVSTFFGGQVNPAWEPNVNSTLTLGRMAVEVPV